MEITVEIDKDEQFFTTCPFCGHKNAEIQWVDYVDFPMIWCWSGECHETESKNCRAVLDCTEDFMSEKQEEAYNHFEKSKERFLFTVKLCKIIGVADGELNDKSVAKYVCDNNNELEPWDKCDKENFCSKHEYRREYVVCDSYNVVCDETKDLCLDHDGTFVYLKCLNSKGEEFMMKYWGD